MIWSLLDVLETEVMVQTCMFYKSCRMLLQTLYKRFCICSFQNLQNHLLHINLKGLAFSSQTSSEKCSCEYKLSAVLHQQKFLGKTRDWGCKFRWLILNIEICSHRHWWTWRWRAQAVICLLLHQRVTAEIRVSVWGARSLSGQDCEQILSLISKYHQFSSTVSALPPTPQSAWYAPVCLFIYCRLMSV